MTVSPDGAPVIELRRVHKNFIIGKRTINAVDGVSADIRAGRITGLVGPDGAGKTTLMRLLTGLLKPDDGTIRVLGMDAVTNAHGIQSSVGYMPQRFGLYEDLSVNENLELYANLQGLAKNERASRFDQLMAFSGLDPFRKRLAGRLSGGMKQKLGLACTLVRPPRLLLLDEPSVGVDPVSRRELWDIVQSLIAEGITVLWSTAYLDEAERCDDVLLFNEGCLLEAGPPGKFSTRLKGRSFTVQMKSVDRRAGLMEINTFPNITDAIIKGRNIRVLIANQAHAPDFEARCSRLHAGGVTVESVEPTFEDAFIDILKEKEVVAEVTATSDIRNAQSQNINALADEPIFRDAIEDKPGEDPSTNREEVVIEVVDLVRKFGDFTAVDGIDFSIKRGEIFGLLGPNGAGKSTTFKMLCGLLPPSDGRALVLGIDLRRSAAIARSRIGYMAQKFSLYGNMSVYQNMQFFASAYGLENKLRRQKIDEEMREFGLAPYTDVNAETLPLGYKQRLALACAIMHDPGVLFLDEPTSGVDPLVRREFWTRINAMAAAGVTVMVTTHFMEEAEYCDRIGIIYQGQLVALGTPDDLKNENRKPDLLDPTLEDAFINLIEDYNTEHPQ